MIKITRSLTKEEKEIIDAIQTLRKYFPNKFTIQRIEIEDEYGFNFINYGRPTSEGPFSDTLMWQSGKLA